MFSRCNLVDSIYCVQLHSIMFFCVLPPLPPPPLYEDRTIADTPGASRDARAPKGPPRAFPEPPQSLPKVIPRVLPDAPPQMPPPRCLPSDASSQMPSPRCLLPDAFSQMRSNKIIQGFNGCHFHGCPKSSSGRMPQ